MELKKASTNCIKKCRFTSQLSHQSCYIKIIVVTFVVAMNKENNALT